MKKTGLSRARLKDKLIYAALIAIPSLQFVIFYISVNLNSFSLAFKVFDVKGIDYTYGFDNFVYWFTDELSNAKLKAAIWVSIKSYLLNFVISVPLGLFFSYYMFKKMPMSGLFRTLLFLPSILSAATLAVIFQQITDGVIGSEDGFALQLFGEARSFWDLEHGYGSLMFFCIFFSFGTNVLMYTNKMNGIDPEIIEAGLLDGANGIKEFWYIILPQTFPIIKVFLTTGFAAIFTNQYNYHILLSQSQDMASMPLGFLLWNGVAGAKGSVVGMGIYASLGLMITFIIAPLTFLLRGVMNKVGWKEE